jgi:uncharacterized YigZ family protein
LHILYSNALKSARTTGLGSIMSEKIFHTLSQESQFCYEEKRSRFLAFVLPTKTKEEGFERFENIKKQYPDARHHCWAYVIGNPEHAAMAGFNDDGEPNGTAGKPMLNVLIQRKVGNVFAVVVRYFGGVKLGAGGLTRAYGQAISGALDNAEFQSVIPMATMQVIAPFSLEHKIRTLLQRHHIYAVQSHYEQDNAYLTFEAIKSSQQSLCQEIQEQTSGKARCTNNQLDRLRHIPCMSFIYFWSEFE